MAFGAIVIAACEPLPPDTPIASATAPITIIPASATVAPIPPTVANLESSNVGVQGFTPGIPVDISGSPTAVVSAPPIATQASIPMTFVSADGLIIAGTYYSAAVGSAPTMLLLHIYGSNKEAWQPFATQLQKAGYNALAIDLRGHGATGGDADWTKAPSDVTTVITRLLDLPDIDRTHISVIGASIGANLGVVACAETQLCRSLVLLSPSLNYANVQTAEAMAKYGKHPVLIFASRDDKPSGADSPQLDKLAQGDHNLRLFDGTVNGTALFNTQPDLSRQIIEWLNTH